MRVVLAVWILLLAVPGFAVKFTPEEVARIGAAKVGEIVGINEPAGDGCNTCTAYYLKVSDSEVRHTGMGSCTLLACMPRYPPIKFRERMPD